MNGTNEPTKAKEISYKILISFRKNQMWIDI